MTDYGSRAAPAFDCPPTMAWHVNKVLSGERDIPYEHPNPVILDIGANVGAFAMWASRRWPGSHIHCYEPLPENFALLRQNLAALAGRIEFNECAIGDPAHTRLFLGRNNCGEASFFDIGEQRSEAVQVTTKPPSVLPRADILKMDVEGAEIETGWRASTSMRSCSNITRKPTGERSTSCWTSTCWSAGNPHHRSRRSEIFAPAIARPHGLTFSESS